MNKKIFLLLFSFIYLNAGFLRNDTINVVVDTKTNLIWSDQETNILERTWKNSVTYCEDLKISFYEDWRMPNYNELYSLVDLDKTDTKIDDVFKNKISSKYWTSTAHVSYSNAVWNISFANGNDDADAITGTTLNIRCVHD